ncbi:MAG: long-chain fatty acid--CoA ligase [Treponema sp.]|jgi:non-ribosomal peptide synthetase component F|nr:long-chain fatty acid--CoA ligase [Treponema sp.]
MNNVNTLGDLCLWGAKTYKSRKAFELCRGDRLLETLSYRALAIRARQLAALLQSIGVKQGDKVMILGENSPAWPAAAYGNALAGAISLPVSPEFPGEKIREIGERAGLAALFVTRRTAALAGELDPRLPRIYLDSPAAGKGMIWTSITVSIGGLAKDLTLGRPAASAEQGGPDEEALQWPDGSHSSHGELITLAHDALRLFPRDRIVPLCSLAEKGAFVRGMLGAALGGASVSCLASQGGETPMAAEFLQTVELLRPTVVLGDGGFLNSLYREKAAAIATGPLSRFVLTRPLAQLLAGRKAIKALGGNIRFYGVSDGPAADAVMEKFLSGIHVPWGIFD